MFSNSNSCNDIQFRFSGDSSSLKIEDDLPLPLTASSFSDFTSNDGVHVVFRDASENQTVFDFADVAYNNYGNSFFADEPVSRGICDAINVGAMSISNDEIISRVGEVPSSSSVSSKSNSLCFAPSFHPLRNQNSQPLKPGLIPYYPMQTLFNTTRSLDEVVSMIKNLFEEMDRTIKVTFVPYEFLWQCSFLSNNAHVNFNVRIYRYPLSHQLCCQYAVEFQRIEGDRTPFMNIFIAARELLTGNYFSQEDFQDFMINRCHLGEFGTPVNHRSAMDNTQAPAVDQNEYASQVVAVKGAIISHLTCPQTYANLLESVKSISSLYSTLCDNRHLAACPQDLEVFRALCAVARHYSANSSDWIFKHSIIAVADMLSCFDAKFFTTSLEPVEQQNLMSLLRNMAGVKDEHPHLREKSFLIATLVGGL